MTANIVNIDLSALRRNFTKIKAWTGSRILCIVKADAYGHGMIPVARLLKSAGAGYFGVFEAEEGVSLRENGIDSPILVLKGIERDEIAPIVECDLTPAVFDADLTRLLSEYANEHEKIVSVHIKVDTGMGRLGVPWDDVSAFVAGLVDMKGIRIAGIFSHFAVADEPDRSFTRLQMKRFEKAVSAAQACGVGALVTHIANSGAILDYKGVENTLVRPGIILYGSFPSTTSPVKEPLEPVMGFSSRVIQVKTVPAGSFISYGCTYRAKTDRRIATIPVGYDDGYSRLLSNRGSVLIRGQRAPVVGVVCMNLTMVDVTKIKGVSTGDEVVLLGSQADERICAEEIAEQMGSVGYEVYCLIGKSNKRCYTGEAP